MLKSGKADSIASEVFSMAEPNHPESWQMDPPQGKPLYSFDTHETEKLYV